MATNPEPKPNSIVSSISDILAHTFTRKFKFSEAVNTSVFTLFMAGLTWISTSGVSKNFIMNTIKQMRFRRNPIRTLSYKQYKSGDIRDDMMISKFIEYMACYQKFYNCQSDLVVGDMRILYDQIREPIAFDDKNFNVKGKLQFYESEKQISKKKPEPMIERHADMCVCQGCVEVRSKQHNVTEINININLYDCECNDLAEYIKNVVQHEALTGTVPVKTMKYYVRGTFMNKMVRYINLHRSFYHPDKVVISDETPKIFFDADKTILFHDTKFNVRGYIMWQTGNIILSHCDLPENYTVKKYVSDIFQCISEHEKSENTITLYNQYSTTKSNIADIMYSNVARTPEELEKLFIKTLFHPMIDELWGTIKKINYEPHEFWKNGMCPRINLLLHGPPGTGKSTFAHRIAMATNRHLINISINKYTKDELITLFRQPVVNGIKMQPREVVFVLDELDISIKSILVQSTCKTKQLEKIEETMDGFFQNVMTSRDAPQAQMPIKQIKQKKKSSDDTEEIEETPQVTVADVSDRITNAGKYLDTINKTFEKMNSIKSDIITLDDLLTVFQGATPIEGCIIIAMTNKFDELETLCPKLFRPGRLTPVYFGNFNVNMVMKVSKYFFGKTFEVDEQLDTELPIPPAQIMELVSSSLMQHDKYERFIDGLKRITKLTIKSVDGETVLQNPPGNFTLYKSRFAQTVIVKHMMETIEITAHQTQGNCGIEYCLCCIHGTNEVQKLLECNIIQPGTSTHGTPNSCCQGLRSEKGYLYVLTKCVINNVRAIVCQQQRYKYVITPEIIEKIKKTDENTQEFEDMPELVERNICTIPDGGMTRQEYQELYPPPAGLGDIKQMTLRNIPTDVQIRDAMQQARFITGMTGINYTP